MALFYFSAAYRLVLRIPSKQLQCENHRVHCLQKNSSSCRRVTCVMHFRLKVHASLFCPAICVISELLEASLFLLACTLQPFCLCSCRVSAFVLFVCSCGQSRVSTTQLCLVPSFLVFFFQPLSSFFRYLFPVFSFVQM